MAEKSLIDNPEDIQLNEFGEIQQILGHPPGWMLKWGISLIFIAIAILLTMAWFIKYPDVVPARAVLTTENPLIRVKAPTQGRVMELLVDDEDEVSENQLLVVIENPAKKEDINKAESLLLPLFDGLRISDLLDLDLPKNLELGTLQALYSKLNQDLEQAQFTLDQASAAKKIRALKKQKASLNRLNNSLENQIENLIKEKAIADTNLIRELKLKISGGRSDLDVEKAQEKVYQAERAIENSRSNKINNELAIEKIESQILSLEEEDVDQKNKEYIAVKEDIKQFLSEINSWKQSYLVYAPIAGKVTMPASFTAQKFVNESEELFSIVPMEGTGRVIAKAALAATGHGKVEEEMDVHLRLDAYPYKEFGMIIGKVESIGLAPQNNPDGSTSYELIISLPDPLISSYGDTLSFRQEMESSITVITEKRTFLSRIFDNIWDIIYNN